MKSLVEHVNERLINEAKCVCDQIPAYDDDMDNREEVCGSIERFIDNMEAVTPKDLKKVRDWKGFEMDKLEDYTKVASQVAAWIRGVAALGEDDADSCIFFKTGVESISDGVDWPGFENSADNLEMDADLQTASDYDAIEQYLEDVCKHWNEISKIVNHMPWT